MFQPRFDWYQGTVKAPVGDVMQALTESCDGIPRWDHTGKGHHGYERSSKLYDMDGLYATVWEGGMHSHPHVVASGAVAHHVAESLRTHFNERHTVSRCDACVDYADPGAYDLLQEVALGVAKDKGIKVGTAGDHLLSLKGRTLYLGASTSHTRLRLYDKAAELREKLKGSAALEIPEHLARLELQVRPKTPEAKAAAAQASPLELMGSASWMRELLRRAEGLEIQPFAAGREWRQADDDRSYAALLAQYGGLLSRIKADLGGWDVLGMQIGHDLEKGPKRR
jgi:hypothetical protein